MSMLIHICRKVSSVNEGGGSRDYAFIRYFSNYSGAKNVIFDKWNILSLIHVFFVCLVSRGNIVLIHITTPFMPVSKSYIGNICRYVYLKLIKHVSLRNKLIVEVNDLPVEQAADLMLPIPYYFSEIECSIFGLDSARFIFASWSMRDFCIQKYSLHEKKCFVCVNGANRYTSHISVEKEIQERTRLICVYAGTLNKGRSIESMILLFSENPSLELVLLGANGSWLNTTRLPNNVRYLGSLNENEAQAVVSTCDIGLIPYDSNRKYYNIAFPTKIGFYMLSGIPVLMTPTDEMKMFFRDKEDSGILADFTTWAQVLTNLTKEDLCKLNNAVVRNSECLVWDNLISNCIKQVLL